LHAKWGKIFPTTQSFSSSVSFTAKQVGSGLLFGPLYRNGLRELSCPHLPKPAIRIKTETHQPRDRPAGMARATPPTGRF
jgi:hypothetical protein